MPNHQFLATLVTVTDLHGVDGPLRVGHEPQPAAGPAPHRDGDPPLGQLDEDEGGLSVEGLLAEAVVLGLGRLVPAAREQLVRLLHALGLKRMYILSQQTMIN